MPKTIILLAVPGVQLLDVSGPLDVFAEANIQAGQEAYRPLLVATEPGPVRSSSGVRLMPDHVVGEAASLDVDTLLVAGAPHVHEAQPDPGLLTWLRDMAPKARGYGSA